MMTECLFWSDPFHPKIFWAPFTSIVWKIEMLILLVYLGRDVLKTAMLSFSYFDFDLYSLTV